MPGPTCAGRWRSARCSWRCGWCRWRCSWFGRGPDDVFAQIAVFFSKMAVVTFGGAYAVLAYVAQQAVDNYGWVTAGEMLDGLGMAESTPGPLIMVTQFVGFLGAWRDPGGLNPLLAGTLGGLLTTWVTFTPCFLWIFVGAPFVEALRTNKALSGALGAITAAVVGVILNLAVWFGLQVLFGELRPVSLLGGYGRYAGAGVGQLAGRGAGGVLCRCYLPLQVRDDPGPAGQLDGRYRLRIDAIEGHHDRHAPRSPFHQSREARTTTRRCLQRGIGIKFDGQEKTNVEEYCVSEGWIRVAVGKTRRPPRQPAHHQAQGRGRALLRQKS